MIKFVEHRIGDRRIVRLIQKGLKAGVMEQGRWFEAEEGTPQGAVISPILANLYLLCFRKHNAECIVTRSSQLQPERIAISGLEMCECGTQHYTA